ncbi:hypothetical protein BKA69DRAFT_1031120 [Paraphysoderma sedebokerense]|nr:hypothetical protein BKA69DRAFT_1031120 [Paraphysoderma sedebokerense]
MPVSETTESNNSVENSPGLQQKLKYFTPTDVAKHDNEKDCWLSWLGNVYNLTGLIQEYKSNKLLIPIIRNAGKDISHWFDPKTGNVKSFIDPVTNCSMPFTPDGRFVQIPPAEPRDDFNMDQLNNPWWMDIQKKYWVGKLSANSRKIKIVNTLTKDEHVIEICSEENLLAVQEKFLTYNAHAKGYMWKRLGKLLDMDLTLEENEIVNESDEFIKLEMNDEEWLPVIHLYFTDDLTVA